MNETEVIRFHKSGSILREYPTDTYALNLMAGVPCIMERESRKVVFVPAPAYYDYIEIDKE